MEAMRELRVENQFGFARPAEENTELRAHNAALEARLARLETLLTGTHESTNAR